MTAIPVSAAGIAAGQARAEVCQACSGAQGVSENPAIPSLAGQRDKFLQWQLAFSGPGRRANEIMGPMAVDLSDEDVRNLGAHFAALPVGKPSVTDVDPALRRAGQSLAERRRCAACHTDNLGGNQVAPTIAHQNQDCLIKALTDYRSAAPWPSGLHTVPSLPRCSPASSSAPESSRRSRGG